MKTLRMKFRKVAAITLSAAMMTGMFPMTASAQEELLLQDPAVSEEQLIDAVFVEEKTDAEEPVVSASEEIQAFEDDLAESELLTEQDVPAADQIFDDTAEGIVPEGDPEAIASVTLGTETDNFDDLAVAVASWNEKGAGATLTLLKDVTTNATILVDGGTEASPMVLDLNDHGIMFNGSGRGSVITVGEGKYFELVDTNTTPTKRWIKQSDSEDEKGRGIAVYTEAQTDGAKYIDITGGYITGGMGNAGSGQYLAGGIYNAGYFTMNGGSICGNLAFAGGGVYSVSNFVMNGGMICHNNVEAKGGGISVKSGTFTMNGGQICNNKSNGTGGGVSIQSASYLSEGTISGNIATRLGGGVWLENPDGMVSTICNVNIYNNKSNESNGGGIANTYGKLIISGGTVSGNTAIQGGGLYAQTDVRIDNETEISSNNASEGAGIYNTAGSKIIMKGGVICDNTASGEGGGVYNKGEYAIRGGEIKTNTGYGIYNDGTLTIYKGEISNNSDKAVQNTRTIVFNGKVRAGGNSTGMDSIEVESETAASHINDYGYIKVTAESGGTDIVSVTSKGGSETKYSYFDEAVDAWNDAGAGATLKLLDDIILVNHITVSKGTEAEPMVLDLNGHGLMISEEYDDVINVVINAYVVLKDSGNSQTTHYITLTNGRGTAVSADVPPEGEEYIKVTGGYITGAKCVYGGGVRNNHGTFTLAGGTICGNIATFGGGVWNEGTMIINGGKVINNTAYEDGGGIENRGSLTMNAGEISGNVAGKIGGGVSTGHNRCRFIMNNGKISGNHAEDGGGIGVGLNFEMINGEITGNIASRSGGGIFSVGIITISGGKIDGNTAPYGNAMAWGIDYHGWINFVGTVIAGTKIDGTDAQAVSIDKLLSELSTYGYLEVTKGHSFTYSAQGATITATCSENECPLPNKTATITINAPEDPVYDGTAKEAKITGDTNVIPVPIIGYSKEIDGEFAVIDYMPIAAGKYMAKMTIESATASVTFTIEKGEAKLTAPVAIDVTYDGTEKDLVSAGSTSDGTICYAVTTTNTLPDDSKYSTSIPKAKDIGSYYVWYKVKGDENHRDSDSKYVKALINGKYTVKFDLNGKSGTAPAAQSIEKNGKAAKPADPTAEGFKFVGWYTDKQCTMGYNFDAPVYSDITLFAKWIKADKNTVKITFYMLGHGTLIPEQIIESGSKVTKPDDPIDKTKVFGGWYAETECKTPFDFKKAVTADTNIYAKWVDKEITGLTAYFDDAELRYNAGLGRYEIVYTGEKIQPSIVVTNNATGGTKLTPGTDYTISYSNNLNVDKNGKPAVVTVKGKGNYSGSKKLLFYILPKSLGSGADATPAADITLSNILVLSGSKVSPVICYKGYKLTNKDFTLKSKTGSLKFSDADALENRKLTIEGKGNFSGCIKEATVTVVNKQEIQAKTIKVTLAKNISLTYNGRPQVLKEGTQLKVEAGGKTLSENYIVSYTNNINSGTAKVTVTGVNGYTGSATKSFKIAPDKSTSIVTATAPAKAAYCVNGAMPQVSVNAVRDGVKVKLTEGVDYTVAYSSNKKVTGKTKAKYAVKFTGNYKTRKTITGTFDIEPAAFNVDVKAANLYYTKPGKYMSAPYVSVGGVLLKNKDYTVKYYVGDTDITDKSYTLTGDSVNVKVVLTGKGNYAATTVTVDNCYTIRKAPENAIDLSKIKVTMKGNIKKSIPTQQYTAAPVVPEYDIWIKVGSEWKNITESGLVKDTDYEVTILNNVNKGTATILISAKSTSTKAMKDKAVKFKIGQKKLTGADQMLNL